jgi:hypothetical protein
VDSEQTRFDNTYNDLLRECDDFKDVFAIVKRCVREYINHERNDLILELVDLPLNIGAAHPVGTNIIVMNEALLDLAIRYRSLLEVQAFVFSILLHEYIHSLGFLNEYEARRLAFLVSCSAFGSNHGVTHLAKYGPWHIFGRDSAMRTAPD